MENIDVQIQLLNKIGNAWFSPTHKDSSQYRNWCGFNATLIFATDNVSRLISLRFFRGWKNSPKRNKKTNNVVLKKTFSVVIFQVEISRSMTYFSCYWSPKFFLKFHLNLTQWAIFPFKQHISSNGNCFVWEKWLNRVNNSIYKQIFKYG